MFKIKIDYDFTILGCPPDGLAAVDFRVAHGLPAAPSDWIKLQLQGESEAICRAFPELLNGDADIDFNRWYKLAVMGDALPFALPPESIRDFLATPPQIGTVLSLVRDQILDRVREEEERKRQREAEREEERKREEGRKREEERERSAWIEAHGSDRLKRCLAARIECQAIYRDERLAAERPGWIYSRDVPGEHEEPRNPPLEAFALLAKAGETAPDARLVFWRIDLEHTDDCVGDCPKYDWGGYAAIAEFEGVEIVFKR